MGKKQDKHKTEMFLVQGQGKTLTLETKFLQNLFASFFIWK